MKQFLFTVKIIILLPGILLAMADSVSHKHTQTIQLGDRAITINIYQKEGKQITFFAPHYNEQIANRLARKYIDKYGGKLLEIESFDERGNPSRYLKFKSNGQIYSIDPNRIFTENGRKCSGYPPEITSLIKIFAEKLLKLIFPKGVKILRNEEDFIVAVHNNSDVETKMKRQKYGDLTASSFTKFRQRSHGFQEQADGVYLSNSEEDIDNFIFVSTPRYISYFAEKGFNVVVQKESSKLFSRQCSIDDGSLSVYSAQNKIQYICLEADGKTGESRQGEMFEAIFLLISNDRKSLNNLAVN